MEGVENAVSLSSWEGECFFEYIYIYIYIYLYIYKKLSLKKIAECHRNIGGLKGNCFLSSFVIKIYIYIYRFAELDYLVEDIYCYSEFHAPCGAIIRQLLKITDTYEDIQNLKIQNNA